MGYFYVVQFFFRFYDNISHTLFLSVPHQSIFVYIWIKKKWFNYMAIIWSKEKLTFNYTPINVPKEKINGSIISSKRKLTFITIPISPT